MTKLEKVEAVDTIGQIDDKLELIREMSQSIFANIDENVEEIKRLDYFGQRLAKKISNYNYIINEYLIMVREELESLSDLVNGIKPVDLEANDVVTE